MATQSDGATPGPKAHTHLLSKMDAKVDGKPVADLTKNATLTNQVNALINANNTTENQMQGVIDDEQDARLTALEAAVKKLQGPVIVPVPPVIPPVQPPSGKIVPFPVGGTELQMLAMMKDLTIDAIEIIGGTHHTKDGYFPDVDRTAAHPLRIMAKGDVIWDGSGTANVPPWRIGWTTKASYITWDAGPGGTFTAQNYALGKAGLIMVRYFDHITFNGLKVRNVYGDKSIDSQLGQQHTHGVYLMGNPARSQVFQADNWDIVGPANRMLNGLQTDGGASVDHVHASNWKVSNLHRAAYLWTDPTDVVIDGWTIADSDATIDNFPNTAKGVVKNCHATNSGPLAPGKGAWAAGQLVDGGGNTAS